MNPKIPLRLSGFFVLVAASAIAAEPRMVADLNNVISSVGSNPLNFSVSGGALHFQARTVRSGSEWWQSDGTTAGTSLVLDLRPGPFGGVTSLGEFAALGGVRYFFADDGVNGGELWRSDGTAAGTVMVRDLNTGLGHALTDVGGRYKPVAATGSRVFFFADNGTSGLELWSTDGTSAGITIARDIGPGSASGIDQWTSLVGAGAVVFFTPPDAATGRELWRSDGTPAGTFMLRDIYPGSGSGIQSTVLFEHAGILYFSAWDGVAASTELWRSDGTPAGTFKLKAGLADAKNYTVLGSTVYFNARGTGGAELWRTNGTVAGTVVVADLRSSGGSDPAGLTAAGTSLYFSADDGLSGRELYILEAGAVRMVANINPPGWSAISGAYDYGSNPIPLGVLGGQLIFHASNGVAGGALWKTDGTTAGTTIFADPVSGTGNFVSASAPEGAVLGGRVFFRGNDGVHGPELWATDGTAAGTAMVRDLENSTASSSPANFAVDADGTLYFTTDNGIAGREVWRSNGTAAGTAMLGDQVAGNAGFQTVQMTPFDGGMAFAELFSSDAAPAKRTLWMSRGTAAATTALATAPFSPIRNISVTGNLLTFNKPFSSGLGTELWAVSPGTAPAMIASIAQSTANAYTETSLSPAVTFGGLRYFTVAESSGWWLWKSDGTAGGTVRVKLLSSIRPGVLRVCGGRIYFSAHSEATGPEPWSSDGTAAGTEMLIDLNPGPGGSGAEFFTETGGEVFFRAEGPGLGNELWKTNGSAAGTVLVKDIRPGTSSFPYSFAESGGRLFFAANNGVNGDELWVSDGTTAGTVMVRDIRPGGSSSQIAEIVAAEGRVYFAAASDDINGTTLWSSDGTTDGTVMLGASGMAGPSQLTVAGGRIFFAASSPAAGTELWSVPVLRAPSGTLTLRALSSGGATFDAAVEPGGHVASAVLEYGATPAYGQSITLATAGDGWPETLMASISGLPAGVPAHARLVITNPDGTWTGPDVVFTPLSAAYQAWLQANFGVSEASGRSLPEADPDGDTASNQFEFLGGTLPQSPASRFAVRFHAANSALELSPVVPGIQYRVETSSDLAGWTTLPPVTFPVQQPAATISLPDAAAIKKFVRVSLQQAP